MGRRVGVPQLHAMLAVYHYRTTARQVLFGVGSRRADDND